MDIMAIVAICFPLGMVLAITWIMSDAGLPRTGFDQHTSKRLRLIERKAA